MKKTMVVLSVVALISTAVWAGPGRGTPPIHRLTEALQLDESQSVQVEQILQDQHEKRMAVREQVKPQLQALDNALLERLQGVLSAEQLEQFVEFREARRERHHRSGPGRFRRDR